MRRRRSNGWTTLRIGTAAVLAALGLVATIDAWRDIASAIASDPSARYTLLVPLAAGWLAWIRLVRLRHARAVGTWVGPLITAAGAAMYVLGDRQLIGWCWHAGAMIVVMGCVLSLLGRRLFADMLPALAVMLFVVPLTAPERQVIVLPLQTLTAAAMQHTFATVGIALERSGNLLSLNGMELLIADARSGLRMIFVLLLTTYVLVFAAPMRVHLRVLLLAASPLLAILANMTRLLATIWTYRYSSPRLGEVVQATGGGLLLLASLLCVLGTVVVLRRRSTVATSYRLAHD